MLKYLLKHNKDIKIILKKLPFILKKINNKNI